MTTEYAAAPMAPPLPPSTTTLQQQQQPQQHYQYRQPDERSAEQAAFEYLNNVLTAEWADPLEIEVLPPSLQQDEYVIRILDTCIGIPEKLLALAFVYARLLFFNGLPQMLGQGLPAVEHTKVFEPGKTRSNICPSAPPFVRSQISGIWGAREANLSCVSDKPETRQLTHNAPLQLLMSATQIILLLDPEHLTAANARKHALRNLLETSSGFSGTPSTQLLDEFIRQELWMLDSLQSSPLPKHTKSSTLWHHRKWLTDEFLEWVLDVQRADILGSKRISILIPPSELGPSASPASSRGFSSLNDATDVLWYSFLQPELQIVCQAGERHPSNYQAWDFARKLIFSMNEYAYLRNSDIMASPGPNVRDEIDPARLISFSVDLVKGWCLTHLKDTSGWAFLLDLLGRAAEAQEDGLVTRCFVEVGNLALSMRIRNEPVWRFVRTLLASDLYLDARFRTSFVNELQGWLERELENKNDRAISNMIKIERERGQNIEGNNLGVGFSRLDDSPKNTTLTSHQESPGKLKDRPVGRPRGIDERDGQPLYETHYFDIVVLHFRWIKQNWRGVPRPIIFEPLPPVAEEQPQLF